MEPIVIVTSVLAVITAVYVVLTYKLLKLTQHQTETMIKDRERFYILDLIQRVLTPFIDKLDIDIRSFKQRNYIHDGGLLWIDKLGVRVWINDSSFNDFKEQHSNLAEKIDKHNQKRSKLEEELKNLKEVILTPEFEKVCFELTNDIFNESQLESVPKITVDFVFDKLLMDREALKNKYPGNFVKEYVEFWDKHGDRLAKQVKSKKSVKDEVAKILTLSDELKREAEEIKEDLEEIRNQLRKEYKLPLADVIKSIDIYKELKVPGLED